MIKELLLFGTYKKIFVALIALFLLLVILKVYPILRIRQIDKKLDELTVTLYVPQGAILLSTERRTVQPVQRGCVSAQIDFIYGINRPLDDIKTEYDLVLLTEGWENRAVSPHVKDKFVAYSMGPEVDLLITSLEDHNWHPLHPTPIPSEYDQFTTTYVVRINYTEPSNNDCWG